MVESVIQRRANWASAYWNHTSGLDGKKVGSLKATACTAAAAAVPGSVIVSDTHERVALIGVNHSCPGTVLE